MLAVTVLAALAVLALLTQAGVILVQRAHPARGRMIAVEGTTLHVLDLGPRDAKAPPIVMLHGASSNLEVMRQPLGKRLTGRHRVILIDRPGHGWSTRERPEDSTPQAQAPLIDKALEKLGVGAAIFVVHSWSGALGLSMALDHPARTAGLVLLAPVAYPWPGGVGRYNRLIATPIIGPLLAYTITLPLGIWLTQSEARGAFLPQTVPDGFVRNTATPLVLRPREFIANARELVALKQAVAAQAPRYGAIKAPITIIAGDADKTVSTGIHSRPLAAAVPDARLIVLPDVGHMIQNAAPDLVVAELEAMVDRIAAGSATARR